MSGLRDLWEDDGSSDVDGMVERWVESVYAPRESVTLLLVWLSVCVGVIGAAVVEVAGRVL